MEASMAKNKKASKGDANKRSLADRMKNVNTIKDLYYDIRSKF